MAYSGSAFKIISQSILMSRIPEYFDPSIPTVTQIRERYSSRFVDLTQYDGLTHENVADGILEAGRKGYGVIIPEGPGSYQFWDRGEIAAVRGRRIPMNSALRFMRYGPHIDLTKRKTTLRDINDQGLTPRRLFREVLGDPETRRELLVGSYRGIGWWDPKRRLHRLLPFDVPAEGQKFSAFYHKEMRTTYQHRDAYVEVPSLSRGDERRYIVTVRVLPTAHVHEWTMTDSPCGCEDRFFRGSAGQVKEDVEIRDVYRYAVPEEPFCRHGWGALVETQRRSGKEAQQFLVRFPEATGSIAPWYTLSTATIVRSGNRERRPLKTEGRVQLGRIIGYAGPDAMFDLSE
jgi:hypothetical protein